MRRRTLLRAAGIASATALAGCGGKLDDRSDATETTDRRETDTATETTTASPAASALELDGHELARRNEDTSNEVVSVVGTLVNRGESPVESAAVDATFLDADGNALGTSRADTDDLAVDASWSFDLAYADVGEDAREVADYTLDAGVGD